MPTLFDYQKQKKFARDFYDQYGREDGEVTDPRGRAFLEQHYQEPTASPILERGALEQQLAAVDALKRQLIARGMNNTQAEDAAERALRQDEAALGTLAGHIEATRGPGQLRGTGEGSYENYLTSRQGPSAEVQPTVGDFPEPPSEDWITRPPQQQALTLDDWSRQTAMEQQMARDTSAATKAEYDVETLPGRIETANQQAATSKQIIDYQVTDANFKKRAIEALDAQLTIANDPKSSAEAVTTALAHADNINRIVHGRSGGGAPAMPGQDPNQWTDAQSKELESATLAAEGASAGTVGGTRLIAPTTEKVVGEYQK